MQDRLPFYKRRPRTAGAIGGGLGVATLMFFALVILNARFGMRLNGYAWVVSALAAGAVFGAVFPRVGRAGFHLLEGVLSNLN